MRIYLHATGIVDGNVRIAVHNTGATMTPAQLDGLFKPFTQFHG
jgi:hypothetical protein